MRLVLKYNFESLHLFEPSFTQFTQVCSRGPWAQGMRKEPDFYHISGMPNSIRRFPMQNFKLLMMNLLMLLNMLNEIFRHTIISIKRPKTVGNTCRLFYE